MEKDKIDELLEEEIVTQLEDLSNLPAGSKEKSFVIDDLIKLSKMKTDRDNMKEEILDKEKDRKIKVKIAKQDILIPFAFYAVWVILGFKFEEKGSISSSIFRDISQLIKPKRK